MIIFLLLIVPRTGTAASLVNDIEIRNQTNISWRNTRKEVVYELQMEVVLQNIDWKSR